MGTKFYFLLVLPLSADDIIPVAVPPMSAAAAGVPGGCSPRCAALPTLPQVGGGNLTYFHTPAFRASPHSFLLSFIYLF